MNSMTGYGKGRGESYKKIYNIELKSVNHRFLEVKSRLPKGMLLIEDKIDKYIKEYFNRGSFSVYINIENNKDFKEELNINYNLAESYFNAGRHLKEHLNLSYDLSLQDIIGYPEVVSSQDKDEEQEDIWVYVKDALAEACKNLGVMRDSEGQKLKEDCLLRMDKIAGDIKEIEKFTDYVVDEYKTKLNERIKVLLDTVPINEDRLAYEVTAFADKSNITEEIVRLRIHIDHFKEFSDLKEPVGRKLDFLIQEMNREINTIGSKSSSTNIATIVVGIKSEIEKIREQIQNIE